MARFKLPKKFDSKMNISANSGGTITVVGGLAVIGATLIALVNSPNIVGVIEAAKGTEPNEPKPEEFEPDELDQLDGPDALGEPGDDA